MSTLDCCKTKQSKMTKASEDIESFLKNVDEISNLVKEMNSSDVWAQQRAVEEADRYLEDEEGCKTRLNRTTINTHPPQQPPVSMSSKNDPNTSSENFMKIMEKDAEDRRLRRRVKEENANALKDKGNEAYAQGDYEVAVKYYTSGLEELRDMQPLYTNRAQAYIKLAKYKHAISDCEWALKCDEKCVKAYLHMGRAHLALHDYKQSRNCFQKILDIDLGKEKMVKGYLTQVDQEEERGRQEREAMEELDKGVERAATVPQLLQKLSRQKQSPVYYCGGLELLAHAITDCTGQTLFRLNNGFAIINTNDTVRSCLMQCSSGPHTQELCVSVLRLWRVICNGNDENQNMLMSFPAVRQSMIDLLASETVSVRTECLELLCLYSQTLHGKALAIDNLNLHMLVVNLMTCITKHKHPETTALSVLENLAMENKFCMHLRDTFTVSIGSPFTSLLRNLSSADQHVLPSLISAVGCMAKDDIICREMANRKECWDAFHIAMERCGRRGYREILYPLLGLMIHLSSPPSPAIQEHAVPIICVCLDLLRDTDGGIVTRATGVLSTVLPQSAAATQHAVEGGVVKGMRKLLKGSGPSTTRYAIKTLTVCTAASHTAQEELVKCDKRLSTLRRVLSSSDDEVVLGNAALCLGHCLGVKGAASSLLGTDTVLLLLRHAAGGATRAAVQKNAAIALGRLCRAEPRHMTKLRELHGMEVLHSCMKLIT